MHQRKRVIIKNTTSPTGVKFPYLNYRDQLGVLIANAGDAVVMRKPLEEDLRGYLCDLGLIPENLLYLTRCDQKNDDRFDVLFKDPSILESLSGLAGTHELLPFYITEYELGLSKKTGLPLSYRTPSVNIKCNRKSEFRKLAKSLGIPIPFGFESVPLEKIVDTLDLMFNEGRGRTAERAVIKHDLGSAGQANLVIHRNIFTKLDRGEKNKFLQDKLGHVLVEGAPNSFVIEEWLSPLVASPSIFFECTVPGNHKLIFLHDQVFWGRTTYYNGCVSLHEDIGTDIRVQLESVARRVLDYLFSEEGFTGFAGFDAVVTKTGIYIVDANLRLVSGYFPMTALRKIAGDEPVVYFNSSISIPLEYAASFEQLMKFLQPLLYAPRQKEGVVILGTFPYFSENPYRHIEYLCIAKDQRSLREITAAFTNTLYSL